MQRFLGTTPQLKNVHITFDCDSGDCSAKIRTKQGDSAAFQFNLNDVKEPLELEWVECPKTQSCFGEILSLIVASARSSGWKGKSITLDADDKGSGKLVHYYERFGFEVDLNEFERLYGKRGVSEIVKSKQILKTIPMRLELSKMKETAPVSTRKARLASAKRMSSRSQRSRVTEK